MEQQESFDLSPVSVKKENQEESIRTSFPPPIEGVIKPPPTDGDIRPEAQKYIKQAVTTVEVNEDLPVDCVAIQSSPEGQHGFQFHYTTFLKQKLQLVESHQETIEERLHESSDNITEQSAKVSAASRSAPTLSAGDVEQMPQYISSGTEEATGQSCDIDSSAKPKPVKKRRRFVKRIRPHKRANYLASSDSEDEQTDNDTKHLTKECSVRITRDERLKNAKVFESLTIGLSNES